jgi:hypothetical protein
LVAWLSLALPDHVLKESEPSFIGEVLLQFERTLALAKRPRPMADDAIPKAHVNPHRVLRNLRIVIAHLPPQDMHRLPPHLAKDAAFARIDVTLEPLRIDEGLLLKRIAVEGVVLDVMRHSVPGDTARAKFRRLPQQIRMQFRPGGQNALPDVCGR